MKAIPYAQNYPIFQREVLGAQMAGSAQRILPSCWEALTCVGTLLQTNVKRRDAVSEECETRNFFIVKNKGFRLAIAIFVDFCTWFSWIFFSFLSVSEKPQPCFSSKAGRMSRCFFSNIEYSVSQKSTIYNFLALLITKIISKTM